MLRGNKMRTRQSLMDEIAAAFQFFDGFGENWHALRECLSYLDQWLPAESYVVVVERAEEVLAEAPEELWAFFKSVAEAGEHWSEPIADGDRFDRPAKPFHVLMNVSNASAYTQASDAFLDAAQHAEVKVRLI